MPLKGIDLPGEPQEIPKDIPTQAVMDGSGGAGMMPSESIGETSESIGDLPSESLGDMTSESLGVPHAGKIHQDMTSESLGEKRPPGAPHWRWPCVFQTGHLPMPPVFRMGHWRPRYG